MKLTLEETEFIDSVVSYCSYQFYKYSRFHKAVELPLIKFFLFPDVTTTFLNCINFDFGSIMHSPKIVFRDLLSDVLSNIKYNRTENAFIVNDFIEGTFTHDTKRFNTVSEALQETLKKYFGYIFCNSWEIRHFRGMSIGKQYDQYRKHADIETEFPEIKGIFSF